MLPTRRSFVSSLAAGCAMAGVAPAAALQLRPPRALKILVLGGTAFLGPAFVRGAVAKGHTLTLFNRGRTNPGLFSDLEQLRGDREKGELDAPYGGESARARDRVAQTLDAAGQLVTVEGAGELADGIAYELTGGHTRDHQLFRLTSAGRTAVFAGDVLASPGQAVRRFVAKYDFDGEAAAAKREAIAQGAADEGHLMLFYHSPTDPAGHVVRAAKGGLAVEGVKSLP